MPEGYLKIKANLRKQHPKMSLNKLKESAARIYISQGSTKKARSSRARSLKHG